MGSLGVPELLVIFVILLLLFGASKIPQLGKGLGEGIKNFKKGLRGDDSESNGESSDRRNG
jgi:sec-independent protein translocase protein TatA